MATLTLHLAGLAEGWVLAGAHRGLTGVSSVKVETRSPHFYLPHLLQWLG